MLHSIDFPGLALIFGLVFLAVAAHPYTTYPLSLAVARALRGARSGPGQPSPASIDIVFCAFNEEGVIATKLDNVLGLLERDPALTARVYIDGSEDRTAQVVAGHRHERLHVIESTERGGKSRGMNALLAESSADAVIFTDANVLLDDDVADVVREALRDPQVGCLCGHLIYVNADESPTAGLGALYWRIEEAIKQLETDTGSTMGADGSLFAIRRELFQPVPEDIIDDFYTSLNVLLTGHRVVRVGQMRARERSVTVRAEEFRRKVRIACRAFNCHRLLWPRIRQLPAWDLYKYLSHKLLRWVTIYLLGLAALCVVLYTALATPRWWPLVAFGLPAAIALLWAGQRWRIPLLSPLGEIMSMYVATGIGVLQSLQGRRYRTWTIAPSSRDA